MKRKQEDNRSGAIYSDLKYSRLQHYFEDKVFTDYVVGHEGKRNKNKRILVTRLSRSSVNYAAS